MWLMHLGVENCAKSINKSVKMGSITISQKVKEPFLFFKCSCCTFALQTESDVYFPFLLQFIHFSKFSFIDQLPK